MKIFSPRINTRAEREPDLYAPPAESSDDEPGEAVEQPVVETPTVYAISQGATAATVVGGALLVIGSFLPLDEPSGLLSRVASNTIVQQEEWLIPIFGALITLAAINSYVAKHRRASLIVLTVIAIGSVIALASNKSNRTLYPLNSQGEAEANGGGEVVPFGIAIYVVGAGAALAFLGSIGMWKAERLQSVATPDAVRPDHRLTKLCPDCAETILAEARVCKHCGYRFA